MKIASPSTILIHTDGSCLGNPGPGGWGVVIQYDGHRQGGASHRQELSGGENPSTNNRMEMKGMIEALRWVKKNMVPSTPVSKSPFRIELFSDSSLLINTLNKGWKRKANKDLWAELDDLRHSLTKQGATIQWQWVKGHNGHPLNERCDVLANAAAVKAAKTKPRASPQQGLGI